MLADTTTLEDLSIISNDDEHSVLRFIDFTLTTGGKAQLLKFVSSPFTNIIEIEETQSIIKRMQDCMHEFAGTKITNGTIMVVETFYETSIQDIPARPSPAAAFAYRIFNSGDFSFVRYSMKHFVDFLSGMQQIYGLMQHESNPAKITNLIERIKKLLDKPGIQKHLGSKETNLPAPAALELAAFIKRYYKRETKELIGLYSKLDAWYSMAMACRQHHFCFPSFSNNMAPLLQAEQLYHPLLASAVAYDVRLVPEQNFLFITGANMGGKSTFIKAIGVAAYLAHVGMGVPAESMQLSVFDGLLSNINIEDNLAKGESYFYNEVQRIKSTVARLLDGKKWLILIDELFKGTNVEDAMKCSTVVIEGMLKNRNALFILSTHLYEIGEPLKKHSNIIFKYFETSVANGQLCFNYTLKDGISNDRLGYLILKREGVVDLLEKL
jgi:DNA mismatch repair protein MutS